MNLGSRGRALLVVAACAGLAFTRPVGTDYGNLDCHVRIPYCDDPKPVIDALAHGHIGALFHQQSLLGPVSILLRLPFALIARIFGYDTRLVFDLGAFACLLVLGIGALLVADEMARRKRAPWLALVVALGLVVNPLTFRVLHFGRPEEALGAGLVLAAAVFAVRGRSASTGVAAGLAVTNKLWGVLALAPLLLALPRDRRVRGLVAAAITVLVLYGPLAAGDPGRFHGAVTSANKLGTIPGTAGPTNAWWFVMDQKPFQAAVAVRNGEVFYVPAQGWALGDPWGKLAHPLVLALALLIAVLWARSRPDDRADVLLVLALIFLLRCVLDPNNYSYYHLPFLACLVAWEGLARGIPWLGLLSAVCLQVIISISPHVHSAAGITWVYLAWAVPTAAGLALILCRRSRSTPPTERSPTSPKPATA